MKDLRFTAKSELTVEELNELHIPHTNGWVTGWYADGYILGDIIEVDEEYIVHEWWCKVDENTMQEGDDCRWLNIL